MNSPNNIMAQVLAKDALRADLAAASDGNEQAIAREQAASREHDRQAAQLSEVRARIQRDRRSHGAADDEDLEREAELARALAAVEQAMDDAATQAATARETIRAGMGSWLNPVAITKGSIAEHLEAIAAAGAEIERIDSASAAIKEVIAARQAARAAEGARYQEGLAGFLASQALGELPADATFEAPLAAPESPQANMDAATLEGLDTRRAAALAALETLQSALPAVRASVLHQDLAGVLRDYASAAVKEEKLRRRANALRSLVDGFEIHKPDFVSAPLAQPPAAGVNPERDRLASAWPGLF